MKLDVVTIELEKDPQNSVLRKAAQEVSFPLSNDDKELIESMKNQLYEFEGVGLAAPQVGVSKKIALIYIPESAALLRENAVEMPMHVIINAEYLPIDSDYKVADFEGCYSVHDTAGKVPRYNKIKVKYQNEEGEWIEKEEEGFYARVLQHEIDHLNGILLIDKLTDDCIKGNKVDMLKLRWKELSEDKQHLLVELLKKKGVEFVPPEKD